MLKHLLLILALIAPQAALAVTAAMDQEPEAKLSARNICHARGSESYAQTKRFTPFASLEECLKHGRLPKGNAPSPKPASDYRRAAFGAWGDENGDCVNTRHEVLRALSTVKVTMKNRCSVARGRWLDPYSGKSFTKAEDLDIDHLVPLAYAWAHGAADWPEAKRVKFANDPANLFAVDRATNRDKGAKGPLDWLPPNQGFRCQYILRFQRIVLSYRLEQSADEKRRLEVLRQKMCA